MAIDSLNIWDISNHENKYTSMIGRDLKWLIKLQKWLALIHMNALIKNRLKKNNLLVRKFILSDVLKNPLSIF